MSNSKQRSTTFVDIEKIKKNAKESTKKEKNSQKMKKRLSRVQKSNLQLY